MIDDHEVKAIHESTDELRELIDDLARHDVHVNGSWAAELDRVDELAGSAPEVAVALLGGTGAGKSTLINALSRKRILPVSSMKACTSAITEVAYGAGGYSVSVEFIDRDSWLKELYQLEQDIADARSAGADDAGASAIGREAMDKVTTVYGDSAGRYLTSLDQTELDEPAEITDAFARGSVLLETEDDSVFRDELKRYLDSDDRYWPIVKQVRVRGPFDDLDDGVVLVDLPGLNDPNIAREAATKEHLRNAQFVWVVFNMKRALTRDVYDYLAEGDLLRQLFLDGRTGSLTFVGTALDDVDEDNDIDRLGLDDEATTVEIVQARAQAVTVEVRNQLEELATVVTRDALEPGELPSHLKDELAHAPIHCVSAKEFQKILGIMRKRNQVLHDPDDTGIPTLLTHLKTISTDLGTEAHRSRINQALENVRQDVERTVATAAASLQAQREASEQQLEEVREAATHSRRFLTERSIRAREALDEQISVGSDLLSERLLLATKTAEQELDTAAAVWRGMHWATLRATARRGGQWARPDRQYDIPGQIAKPILDGISATWVDFFGHRAVVAVETFERSLTDAIADFVERFEMACSTVPALTGLLAESGPASSSVTKKLVADRLGRLRRDVDERLDRDRRDLSDRVRGEISRALAPAFEVAAAERGSGVRDRMVDILHNAARSVADSTAAEIRKSVNQLLDELRAFIDGEVAEVLVDVDKQADGLTAVVTQQAATKVAPGDLDEREAELTRLTESVRLLAPRLLAPNA